MVGLMQRTGPPRLSNFGAGVNQQSSQIFLPVAFLSSACVLLLAGCQGNDPTLGSDLRNVELRATVEANKSLAISSPVDGKVTSVKISEGSSVQSGELLLTLANPSIEKDYELARAQAALAASRYRNVRSAQGPLGTSGEGQLSRERATSRIVENKRAKLERYRELYKSNDISKQEMEDAENEYAWAVRDHLNEQSSGRPAGGSESAREAALAELQKAQAEEIVARARRDSLMVTAPIGGFVTRLAVTEGQAVYARDPLVDLSDISILKVRGEISAELLSLARPGRNVEVKVFSVPPKTFRTKIDHVTAFGDSTTPGGASVIVAIPNPDGMIQPKTPARIMIRF